MKPSKKNPKVIILLGPPGSGKGTQANLLAEKLNLYYLETSKIIEAKIMEAKKGDYLIINGKKYDLSKEKKLWKKGKLCSPPMVTFWINQKIKELAKEGKGIVMAGSPRSLVEGRGEIPILKKEYGAKNIKVILINLPEKESIWRNAHRRICKLMRHPILFTKETEKLTRCPLDGSKLIRREGLDDPQTIKIRLREYKKRTLPLIRYFKDQGLEVKEINGHQSVEKVYQDILKIVK